MMKLLLAFSFLSICCHRMAAASLNEWVTRLRKNTGGAIYMSST